MVNKIGSHAITQELRDLIGTGGGGVESVLPIQDGGAFVVSGTAISFDKDLSVSAIGTVAHIDIPAGIFASGSHTHPGGGLSGIGIFENSTFKVTGTSISFNNNIDVSVTGTVAFINVSGTSSSTPDIGTRIHNSDGYQISNSTPHYTDFR